MHQRRERLLEKRIFQNLKAKMLKKKRSPEKEATIRLSMEAMVCPLAEGENDLAHRWKKKGLTKVHHLP